MTPPELIAHLARHFATAGHALYLVGGSVRDLLLYRQYRGDLDFTTDAHPDTIQRLASEIRPDAVYSVGAKFGTVGMVFGDLTVEITTYRAEHYAPPSRHPTVSFGVSLEADLARRDFTINAMALPARPETAAPIEFGEIVDPHGGVRDLSHRTIRAVGDAHERFVEDPLRLLRAVRFVAQLGFSLDPATAEAIRANAGLLAGISKERILAEFTKLLLGDTVRDALVAVVDLGLMRHIVPELLEMQRMPRPPASVRGYKAVLPHTLQVVARAPKDSRVRWAALLHDIAKPRTIAFEHGEVQFRDHERLGAQMATTILRRLKSDSKTIETVSKLVAMHGHANAYSDEWTDSAVRRLLREAGDDWPLLLALCRADITSARPERVASVEAKVDALGRRAAALLAAEDLAKLDSPLDGHALMAMFGRPPGRWIGEVKGYLLDLVLDGTLAPDDVGTAERLARAFLAERDGGSTQPTSDDVAVCPSAPVGALSAATETERDEPAR